MKRNPNVELSAGSAENVKCFNKPKFRTSYTPNEVVKEKNNGKAPDFVPNSVLPLADIIDKFNRGQRLTGVNYNLNDNLIPEKTPEHLSEDPDNYMPVRCDDIVEVYEQQEAHKSRKGEFVKLQEEKQKKQQQGSEQVPT